MKAIICTKYGSADFLKIKEVEKPNPKDNELLIKIFATTVDTSDLRIRSFNVPPLFWLPFRLAMGFRKPRKTLGMSFSGEIETIGKDVKNIKVGDQVFGSSEFNMGCHAEYACIPEKGMITIKPKNKTHKESAALFFGANTSLSFLRKGNIQKGQKVLIYGASGSLGTAAVQLAKYFGAEVTGVCSTANLELVRSLGADKVIDYIKEDFTKNNETYDIIYDTVGKSSFSGCLKSLKKKGRYLRAVHLTLASILRGLWINLTSSKKVIGGIATTKIEDLYFLKKLFEEGNMKPVIDKTYPLEKIIDAYRYVERGHKKGNVVITIEQIKKVNIAK
ncbi:NAD(P)-dependent alcohol dehydrogenase [Candidatus Margulisiibacteriota bacterium]